MVYFRHFKIKSKVFFLTVHALLNRNSYLVHCIGLWQDFNCGDHAFGNPLIEDIENSLVSMLTLRFCQLQKKKLKICLCLKSVFFFIDSLGKKKKGV